MPFYKLESPEVLHVAPNYVLNQNYQLKASNYQDYTYPVDGWWWFDTDQEAYQALGYIPPEPEQPPQL